MEVSRKIIASSDIRNWYRKLGTKGGKSKSAAKLAALAINRSKPCHPGKKRGRPPGSKNKKK